MKERIASVLSVPSVTLRRKSDNQLLTPEETKITIAETIEAIALRFPDRFPIRRYMDRGRNFFIGVTVEIHPGKFYLVPSFNGVCETTIKCEFTLLIEHNFKIEIPHKNKTLEKISNTRETLTTDEQVKLLAKHGVLKIGSIGCRKTNWDTAYEIEFFDLPTEVIQHVLARVVDLSNQDSDNLTRQTGYSLTKVNEVSSFMAAIGQRQIFFDAVQRVKEYENIRGLKLTYEQNGNQIPDYKNNTLILSIPLT